MCARNSLGCLLTLAVVVASLSGCNGGGGGDAVVSQEKETHFRPIEKSVERLSANTGDEREDAIENLKRAWEAGELQKQPAEELQNIRLMLGSMAQSDPQSSVKRAAKELLALMNAGGAAPAEQPAEG